MTKLTVAKRVPMVILLGKVAVIQAVPATLKALELILSRQQNVFSHDVLNAVVE